MTIDELNKLIANDEHRQLELWWHDNGTENGTVNGTVKCNAQGLSDYLDIPLRTIKRDLYFLRDKGFIYFAGSNKTGQWQSV